MGECGRRCRIDNSAALANACRLQFRCGQAHDFASWSNQYNFSVVGFIEYAVGTANRTRPATTTTFRHSGMIPNTVRCSLHSNYKLFNRCLLTNKMSRIQIESHLSLGQIVAQVGQPKVVLFSNPPERLFALGLSPLQVSWLGAVRISVRVEGDVRFWVAV